MALGSDRSGEEKKAREGFEKRENGNRIFMGRSALLKNYFLPSPLPGSRMERGSGRGELMPTRAEQFPRPALWRRCRRMIPRTPRGGRRGIQG